MLNFRRPTIKEESQVLLPNPDEALNFGYALHCSDDEALKGTHTQRLAIATIERFRALKGEPGSAEEAYLGSIYGIILSHARGLTRRKQAWLKELSEAAGERQRKLQKMQDARKSSAPIAIVFKQVAPAIMVLAGYLFGKVIALVVPGEIASQTGERMPSLLVGLVFLFVWLKATAWYNDRERERIEVTYRASCQHADLSYELGKRTEYRLYRSKLCEAWKEYTDKDYPETASYEMVIEGDISTRQAFERKMSSFDRETLWFLRRILKMIRRPKKSFASAK